MLPNYVLTDRAELETQSRLRQQTAYLGPGRLLCRVLGQYLMYVDPDDLGVAPHLCMNGFWESWITLAIARCLRPGFRCVDVGANHGYYTLLMADGVGDCGHVLAFEPNPQLAAMVKLSAEINGFDDRVSVIERAAAAESDKTVELLIPEGRAGDASICVELDGETRSETVQTMSIDEATADWPSVDLVKIDAEGAEDEIWAGMTDTIRRNPNLLVVLEMTPHRYKNPEGFIRRFGEDGFVLRQVDSDGTPAELSESEVLESSDWRMLFLQRS